MRTPRRRGATLAIAIAIVAATVVRPSAQSTSDPPATLTVRTAIKATGLVSRPDDGTTPEAAPGGAQALLRVRVEPTLTVGPVLTLNLAYEQRLQYASDSRSAAGLGLLPSATAAPFRLRPLVWQAASSATTTWRHEIDRASAAVHYRQADLTIGRQAIGWGRGVLFTAVDPFVPFSPLEVDREWRAGVDAVRAEVPIAGRSSIDVVGAFGDTAGRSAFAARARGYAGLVDVEVVGGRRARDGFAGLTTSAVLGGAEVHAEAAVFRVPSEAAQDSGGRLVWKAVAGGSHRLPLGSGVYVTAEYHYSGFGAAHGRDLPGLVASPTFVARLVRGDVQILSRHALGVVASYEASPELACSAHWLHSPVDRSGVIAPALTWTFSDALSVLASGYVAYGRGLAGGLPQSAFGAMPLTGLVQLRLYF